MNVASNLNKEFEESKEKAIQGKKSKLVYQSLKSKTLTMNMDASPQNYLFKKKGIIDRIEASPTKYEEINKTFQTKFSNIETFSSQINLNNDFYSTQNFKPEKLINLNETDLEVEYNSYSHSKLNIKSVKSVKSSAEKSLRNLNMANYISSYSPSPSQDDRNFEKFEKFEKLKPTKLNFNNSFSDDKSKSRLNKSSLLNDKFLVGEKIISEFSQKNNKNNKLILYKKITSYLHREIADKEITNFIFSPLPQDKTLICRIIKKSENIMGKIYPTYELFLNSNDKLLLFAKKIYKTTATTYLIFKGLNSDCADSPGSPDSNLNNHLNLDDLSSNNDYLGKVSSNFLVNEFNVFDKGLKPEDKKKKKLSGDVRVQYGSIKYEINVLGIKGPRNMKVYLPQIDPSTEEIILHRPESSKDYIQNSKKKIDGKFKILVNKQPDWDPILKSYFLKFNGRVQQGSAKNFQLIEEDLKSPDKGNDKYKSDKSDKSDKSEIVLQFGLINEFTYAMDFQYPLSPYQAFSICLTSLATKFVCE